MGICQIVLPILKYSWKAISFVSSSLNTYVLAPIATAIIKSLSWTFKNLIVEPLKWTATTLASITAQVFNNVIIPVIKAIGSFFDYIISETYELILLIKNRILKPIITSSTDGAYELYASTWSAVKYIFNIA